MPRYIVKLNDGTRDYYLEYSTIVDAPVTFGMSLEEFTDYYRKEYGENSLRFEFPERMTRVEERGTSSRIGYESAEQTMKRNRAGKNGTRLTIPQIIDLYCVNTDWAVCHTSEEEAQGKECPVEGVDPWADMKAEENHG